MTFFSLDTSIKFVWFVTIDRKIIAAEYRPDIVLSIEESELEIMQALIRMNTRRTTEDKNGIFTYEQDPHLLAPNMTDVLE